MKMAQYKEKYKQIVINSTKGTPYFIRDGIMVINLNSCINKRNNYVKYMSTLKSVFEITNKINFCNFASLCYKLHISYNSDDAKCLLQEIIDITKQNYPNVEFIQNNISNQGEVDIQPLDNLLKFDKQNNYIYVNYVLLECLKILGYVNCQIVDIIKLTNNLNLVIPKDIINTLPITSNVNMEQYNMFKEMLDC